MPKHLNSAMRLQDLLRQAEHFQNNIQVLEAWAKILGVNESNPNKRATQVSERLGWLHRELGVVSVWMQSTNFSESLYSGALTNIECSLSPMLLGASWSQVKQHLRQETLLALAFCTEILPDEETEISSEALSEIKTLLNDFRKSLTEASISTRLCELIGHHIVLIERTTSKCLTPWCFTANFIPVLESL
ncbi:hypothetical protein [Nitrosomonas sp. Nm58]|uniref:hypothetical protein n=1 Tax=Nitrosomonas sp. Nm58 TaxID=200126 RepID=UPI00089ADB1C|nr:hypothetical protein [Nitrosomonas sp. Nm58]SDY94894.1 hypothetical protein SAMN05421754_103417 [Nitrosomonas sp. Nm58]